MKRVLFLLSHHCSGSEHLYRVLDQNPRIQGFRAGNRYHNRQSVLDLAGNQHKLGNAGAIYMDELVENFQIEHKSIYPEVKIIIFVRHPAHALREIAESQKMTAEQAKNYYQFRLGRLEHIARRSRDFVFLTREDFARGMGATLIERYLHLKDPLRFATSPSDDVAEVDPASARVYSSIVTKVKTYASNFAA